MQDPTEAAKDHSDMTVTSRHIFHIETLRIAFRFQTFTVLNSAGFQQRTK